MKTAILVIDVQAALFDPHPQPFEAEEVVTRINHLTGWGRQNGHSIVFIQHERESAEVAFESPGWALQSGLSIDSADCFIRKSTPDSFNKTHLNELLDSLMVRHLIICGYASEFCVDTTTRRAAALGYSIDLAADAHTTHDKSHASGNHIRQHHNQTLSNIKSFNVPINARSVQELIHKTD